MPEEPSQMDSVYKILFEKALSHVDKVFQESDENPEPILGGYARVGDNKFETVVRLAEDYKQLLERQSQMEKDHAAMKLLRNRKVTRVALTLAGNFAAYTGENDIAYEDDPADAIRAAGGKPDA